MIYCYERQHLIMGIFHKKKYKCKACPKIFTNKEFADDFDIKQNDDLINRNGILYLIIRNGILYLIMGIVYKNKYRFYYYL